MKNFRAFNSAVEFYRQIRELRLSVGLKDQLNRAASSIALNLAEGRGRATFGDQMKFFNIAMSSARECQAILILSDLEGSNVWRNLDSVAAQIFCLIRNGRAG